MLINVYVASPDPDPNPRGGGHLPNPDECNFALTSGTNNIYPYPYIDINYQGHRLRITHTQRRGPEEGDHHAWITWHVIADKINPMDL